MNELNQIIENIMERNGYDKNSEYDRKRLLTDVMFDIKDISMTEEELSIMKKGVEEIVNRTEATCDEWESEESEAEG